MNFSFIKFFKTYIKFQNLIELLLRQLRPYLYIINIYTKKKYISYDIDIIKDEYL